MGKFKVGDRVRCYYASQQQCNVGVIDIIQGNLLHVRSDNKQRLVTVYHEKQCRRLKPKQRREFWLGREKGNCSRFMAYSLHETISKNGYPDIHNTDTTNWEWMHVREVKK